MHNEKYLKSKPESYNSKLNTYFQANKILIECSQYVRLSIIIFYSDFTDGNNYYPQQVLEEWKYKVKENQISTHITNDMDICSGDDDSAEEYFESSILKVCVLDRSISRY